MAKIKCYTVPADGNEIERPRWLRDVVVLGDGTIKMSIDKVHPYSGNFAKDWKVVRTTPLHARHVGDYEHADVFG